MFIFGENGDGTLLVLDRETKKEEEIEAQTGHVHINLCDQCAHGCRDVHDHSEPLQKGRNLGVQVGILNQFNRYR